MDSLARHGEQADINVFFTHDLGDVDVQVFVSTDLVTPVASSVSGTDDEYVVVVSACCHLCWTEGCQRFILTMP